MDQQQEEAADLISHPMLHLLVNGSPTGDSHPLAGLGPFFTMGTYAAAVFMGCRVRSGIHYDNIMLFHDRSIRHLALQSFSIRNQNPFFEMACIKAGKCDD
jgi:hypothetical protein